tara:strand:- start:1082 stop:1237 length:156 start_codon:yes stop_codon:yes gene_type:complete
MTNELNTQIRKDVIKEHSQKNPHAWTGEQALKGLLMLAIAIISIATSIMAG